MSEPPESIAWLQHVVRTRDALAEFLRGQADWRAQKAMSHPDDERNASSARALFELADFVVALPLQDERLQRLAAYGGETDVFLAGEQPSRIAGRYGFGVAPDPDDFLDEFLYALGEEDRSNDGLLDEGEPM